MTTPRHSAPPGDLVDLVRRKVAEIASKSGQPAKLAWSDTGPVYYTDNNGTEHKRRVFVRMGADLLNRTMAIAPRAVPPDAPGLDVTVEYQDGVLVVTGWDEGAPILGGLDCAECGVIGGISGDYERITDTKTWSLNNGEEGEIFVSLYYPPSQALAVMDENTVVLIAFNYLVSGDSFSARVITYDPNTQTLSAGSKYDFYNLFSNHQTIVPLTATTFLIVHETESGPHGQAVVGTVSGTSISYGTPAGYESGPGFGILGAQCTRLSVTKAVTIYDHWENPASYHLGITVFDISGTTVTPRTYNPGIASYSTVGHAIARVDADTFVVAYPDYVNGNILAVVCTDTGSSISTGTPVIIAAQTQNNHHMYGVQVRAGIVAFGYVIGATDDVRLVTLGVSGMTIAVLDDEKIVDTYGPWDINLARISDGLLAYGAQDEDDKYNMRVISVAVDGTIAVEQTLEMSQTGVVDTATWTGGTVATPDGKIYSAYVGYDNDDNYIKVALAMAQGGGETEALLLSGALYLPDLDAEPAAPASGAILYSFNGIARVVDASGARDL